VSKNGRGKRLAPHYRLLVLSAIELACHISAGPAHERDTNRLEAALSGRHEDRAQAEAYQRLGSIQSARTWGEVRARLTPAEVEEVRERYDFPEAESDDPDQADDPDYQPGDPELLEQAADALRARGYRCTRDDDLLANWR